MADTMNILNDPFLNKGTAFTVEERKELGLIGALPAKIQTLQEQADQAYGQFKSKSSQLEQRQFLMTIFNTNRTLFYYLMGQHIVEFMPVVYDPVIAESIEQYSEIFTRPQEAAFISVDDQDSIEDSLRNAADGRDIRLIVVTDAEGILGMGDWGVNGVDIAVGKLMVYTAAAGIDPAQVLPVSLDAGTNNETLLNDPLYLGNRHTRVYGEKYHAMVDKFVAAAEKLFPESLLHFEDFGRSNAAVILEKYQDKILTFNDDIQGTGIISLAGVLGAMNISKEKITDQVFLTFGAGTAGVGIANMLFDELVREGLSEKEARKHFYLVDKQGLLFEDTEGLTPGQKAFVRKRCEFDNADELTNLEAVVKAVHPTVMIGTSTQPGTFTESIVKEMAAHTKRPVIFPLSNPTRLAEAKAEDLLKWTDGRALVATGIPAGDIEYNGVTYNIGQANNALVYPGVGFGAIAAKAKILNEKMLADAAHALGGIVDPDQPGAAVLPPVSKLQEFSQTVAQVVAKSAIDQGLAGVTDAKKAVADMKWEPKY
ncbi:malolactic enzyme [Ligilactobacillus murinus]|uniref:Malolactic enzyme n=1 Tax=Ligilactobacillus murinus TaxID=1622 RepID=A0AAE6WHI3_9LACO|nr:malolactic enzyme [Ligilactobacillus murinus]NEF83253.1 NAD-dependent malic enzyme [Ligilactobacillus murinus]NEF85426.1 NAD-dependent malic enzyme [Ligilactobacillus murinus]NEF87855.1 NAD-dependent malic enzyme [Ligilactobacillus murinus]NEF90194.1 NAD-dependent malic enzyme [Ligilactobacillus murinus]NEF92477.1 NAD-dependent malic enzyme [Ligilactobacillus murinus]